MISGETLVALVDVKSSAPDEETGDRTKIVSKAKLLILNVDLVGLQTQQLGLSQGIEFVYSIEIDRNLYEEEKFCYFNGHLYEVKGMSKAKSPTHMLLNVSKLTDEETTEAIVNWMRDKESGNDIQ